MLFFRSKSPGYAQSQSVTSVGIVEAVTDSHSLEELVRLNARGSVYSTSQLEGFGASRSNPNKVIDFLLIGHLDPSMLLQTSSGIIRIMNPSTTLMVAEKPRVGRCSPRKLSPSSQRKGYLRQYLRAF